MSKDIHIYICKLCQLKIFSTNHLYSQGLWMTLEFFIFNEGLLKTVSKMILTQCAILRKNKVDDEGRHIHTFKDKILQSKISQ